MTHGAEYFQMVPFIEVKVRMFTHSIITQFGTEQNNTPLLSLGACGKNNIIFNFQISPAIGAYIFVFHKILSEQSVGLILWQK